MTAEILGLITQIPLAGIVLFLTIRFLEHLDKGNKIMLDFLGRQAETNREFLQAQREQVNLSLARLAEEIKGMRIELAKQSGKER